MRKRGVGGQPVMHREMEPLILDSIRWEFRNSLSIQMLTMLELQAAMFNVDHLRRILDQVERDDVMKEGGTD